MEKKLASRIRPKGDINNRGIKVTIDWDKVDNLMLLNPTSRDIQGVLGYTYETLNNAIKKKCGMTFHEYKDLQMGKTRMMLAQTALGLAKKGHWRALEFCLQNLNGWTKRTEFGVKKMSEEELKDVNEHLEKQLNELEDQGE